MGFVVYRQQQRSGRRSVEDEVELDMVDSDQMSGQRRRRAATSSSTALYSVDDLPRVTHLNDSEVPPTTTCSLFSQVRSIVSALLSAIITKRTQLPLPSGTGRE